MYEKVISPAAAPIVSDSVRIAMALEALALMLDEKLSKIQDELAEIEMELRLNL